MKWGPLQKRIAAFRRQERILTALGYRRHETDWEINRGGRGTEVIVDAIISVDGKYVYTKLAPKVLEPGERIAGSYSGAPIIGFEDVAQ